MEYLNRVDELPTVEQTLKLTYEEYKKYALEILKYKEYCQLGFTEGIKKVYEWCTHLKCLDLADSCQMLSSEDFYSNSTSENYTTSQVISSNFSVNKFSNNSFNTIYEFMQSVGYNNSQCYDDYMCDLSKNYWINHCILGIICFVLCICGIVSNLILLPAYNFGLNRSGSTVYLTAMALFDCIYLLFTLLIFVVHYLPTTYEEQVEAYGQFSGYLIPIGSPLMQFCELFVLWLTLALLVNRLSYLNLGSHSKMICSQLESFKVIIVLFLLCIAYMGCKFLEYSYIEYPERKVVRVLLTSTGTTEIFQNLMYHWLKVPLEMFLPYLGCGLLVSVVVSKMLNLHTSKWKAVASLCNDTACACVCRAGICGTECREGVKSKPTLSWSNFNPTDTQQSNKHMSTNNQDDLSDCNNGETDKLTTNLNNLDPIEQELAYLFFQLPQLDETRENANVITAVCIGLILIMCKIPKFILHVLSTENYVVYDAGIFLIINQFLDTIFAACKPMVCILVGAHFRAALLSPTQCCKNTTVNRNSIILSSKVNETHRYSSHQQEQLQPIYHQSIITQQPEHTPITLLCKSDQQTNLSEIDLNVISVGDVRSNTLNMSRI